MNSLVHYAKSIDSAFTCPLVHYREHAPSLPRVINCSKCETRLLLSKTLSPPIDSCGFENYSLECNECGIRFIGIVDPYDDVLLLSGPFL